MKIKLEPNFYPVLLPMTLIGANVNGKPNFQTTCLLGLISNDPMTVAVTIGRNHHTIKGILENRTFSINLPSEDLVIETDYCGITSGSKVDKSEVFSVFYGELKSAPMIEECKLTMECKVIDQKEIGQSGRGICFTGEIIKVYADEEIMVKRARYHGEKTDDRIPSLAKLLPLIGAESGFYHGIGKSVANTYSIGKEYKKKK